MQTEPRHRLVSWNILAPVYTYHSKYPHSKPEYLTWKYREKKLVQKLVETRADMFCLQEVQLDIWESFFERFRAGLQSKHGHEAVFSSIVQVMERDHPVACTIVYRSDKWDLKLTESRSRALVAVLNHKKSNRQLYLCAVHLEAGRDKAETRWNQIRSLLKRLYHHITRDSSTEKPAIVLAGDFNTYEPSSPLFAILSGNVSTAIVESRPLRSWKGLGQKHGRSTQIWQRAIPLLNAHSGCVPRVTYAGGSVLDYMWVSPDTINVVEAMNYGPVATIPKDSNLAPPQSWPCADVPSDHLPIGMDFQFIS